MMDEVRVGIAGITGRMGETLVHAALETPGVVLGAASSRSHDDLVVGQDAGLFTQAKAAGVAISGSLEYCRNDFDVAIDFTVPEFSVQLAQLCIEYRKGLVIGTTGHSDEELDEIQKAAEQIPIVMSPNMSVGINLMLKLLHDASGILGSEVDVDIIEHHHRTKRDVPSGTALALGHALAEGRGQEFSECVSFKALEEGVERDPSIMHFHILRQTGVVGEHRVIFALSGERLELVHHATDRHIFARGALRAAAWVSRQPPGLYSMREVLSRATS